MLIKIILNYFKLKKNIKYYYFNIFIIYFLFLLIIFKSINFQNILKIIILLYIPLIFIFHNFIFVKSHINVTSIYYKIKA